MGSELITKYSDAEMRGLLYQARKGNPVTIQKTPQQFPEKKPESQIGAMLELVI